MRTPEIEETLIAAPHNAQIAMTFEDNRLASALFGQYGQNLALIERRLGIVATSRGNQVTLEGVREPCEQARRVLETLYERLKHGDELAQGDVDGAIRLALAQGSLFDFDPASCAGEFRRNQSAQAARAGAHAGAGCLCARAQAPCARVRHRDRPERERPGSPSPKPCNCSSAKTSTASSFRGRRSKPASGSASCPATCARKSTLICARSTTRSTI